jgi:hypothetical protein
MKYTYLALASIFILATACKKDKKDPEPATPEPVTTEIANGLPSSPSSVEAYLYAGYLRDVSYNSAYNLSMFSAFGAPARNLFQDYDHQNDIPLVPGIADFRGNVDVGNVTFSGNQTSKSASPTNAAYFTSAALSSSNTIATWKTDGASDFVGIDVTVNRGYPLIVFPLITSIKASTGYAFRASDYVVNYDSVTVRLAANNKPPYGFNIQKTVAASADSIRFTAAELAPGYPANKFLYMSIKAFNYSNKTVANKKYVFELSHKLYNKPLYFIQ